MVQVVLAELHALEHLGLEFAEDVQIVGEVFSEVLTDDVDLLDLHAVLLVHEVLQKHLEEGGNVLVLFLRLELQVGHCLPEVIRLVAEALDLKLGDFQHHRRSHRLLVQLQLLPL